MVNEFGWMEGWAKGAKDYQLFVAGSDIGITDLERVFQKS